MLYTDLIVFTSLAMIRLGVMIQYRTYAGSIKFRIFVFVWIQNTSNHVVRD